LNRISRAYSERACDSGPSYGPITATGSSGYLELGKRPASRVPPHREITAGPHLVGHAQGAAAELGISEVHSALSRTCRPRTRRGRGRRSCCRRRS
jgi:hypothetical protein